jgi:hypothetical protein
LLRDGRWRYVIEGNPHIECDSYGLPFAELSSLRINEALLMSATTGAVPYTDSLIHNRLLRLKLTGSRSLLTRADVRYALDVDVPVAQPKVDLSLALIDGLIGDELLARIPMAELVAYRRANVDQFLRLSSRIAELASHIDDLEPGPGCEVRLRKVIDREALPEIRRAADALADDIERSFAVAVGRAGTVGVTGGGTTLAGSLVVGIDPALAVAVSAVGALLAFGTAAAKAAIPAVADTWRAQRHERRANSFSYLTDLAGNYNSQA